MPRVDVASTSERVLSLLCARGPMTCREAAEALEISNDRARHALEYLHDKKLARVERLAGRRSRWTCSDAPPTTAPEPAPEHDDEPYTLSPSGRPLTPKDEDE